MNWKENLSNNDLKWRKIEKCKILGSLLYTGSAVKNLTKSSCIHKHEVDFKSENFSKQTKTKISDAYTIIIFLYNNTI